MRPGPARDSSTLRTSRGTVTTAAADRDDDPVAVGRVGDVGPSRGCSPCSGACPPLKRSPATTASSRPRLRATWPDSTPRSRRRGPMAGGEDGGQARRHHRDPPWGPGRSAWQTRRPPPRVRPSGAGKASRARCRVRLGRAYQSAPVRTSRRNAVAGSVRVAPRREMDPADLLRGR